MEARHWINSQEKSSKIHNYCFTVKFQRAFLSASLTDRAAEAVLQLIALEVVVLFRYLLRMRLRYYHWPRHYYSGCRSQMSRCGCRRCVSYYITRGATLECDPALVPASVLAAAADASPQWSLQKRPVPLRMPAPLEGSIEGVDQ